MLKWDQEAFEALEHNLEIAEIIGGIGVFFSESFTEAVPVLARLYSAHVSILPLLATLLFVAHFFLVKHHGISSLPERADVGAAPGGKVPEAELGARYSGHLGRMVGFGLLVALVAALLGLVFPAPLGDVPDPKIEVTKPPFYFYWLYAFENWFGIRALLYAGLAFFALLVLVPILDRSPFRSLRRRPVVAAAGAVVLIALVALSVVVFFTPVAEHVE